MFVIIGSEKLLQYISLDICDFSYLQEYLWESSWMQNFWVKENVAKLFSLKAETYSYQQYLNFCFSLLQYGVLLDIFWSLTI